MSNFLKHPVFSLIKRDKIKSKTQLTDNHSLCIMLHKTYHLNECFSTFLLLRHIFVTHQKSRRPYTVFINFCSQNEVILKKNLHPELGSNF